MEREEFFALAVSILAAIMAISLSLLLSHSSLSNTQRYFTSREVVEHIQERMEELFRMKNEMVDSIKRSSKPHETAGSLDLPFISFALNSGIYILLVIAKFDRYLSNYVLMSETLKVEIDEELLKKFKRKAYESHGFKKGAIKKAMEELLKQYTSEGKSNWNAIAGILKDKTETSVDLQHKAWQDIEGKNVKKDIT